MNSADKHARFMGMVNLCKEEGVKINIGDDERPVDPLDLLDFLRRLFEVTQPPEPTPREVRARSTEQERWNSMAALDAGIERLSNDGPITVKHVQTLTRIADLQPGDQSWVASYVRQKNGGYLFSPTKGWSLTKLVTNKKKDDDENK